MCDATGAANDLRNVSARAGDSQRGGLRTARGTWYLGSVSVGGVWCGLLTLCAVGCGLARPYTSVDLQRDARERAGAALLHYLSQDGADPAACLDEQVLAGFTTSDLETFVAALEQGDVAPVRWTACARRLVAGLHGAVADDALAQLVERLLANLDTPEQRVSVLEALAAALEARPSESRISDDAIAELGDALRGRELGSQARAIAAQAHEGLEMSRSRFRGAAVDEHFVATCSDVAVLQRFARLLPTPVERRAARTRYVELAVAASPSAYVRAHAERTRAQVLATGRNALDLTRAVITRTSFTATDSPDTAVVEQNVAAQTARLLLRSTARTALLPAVDLRWIVRFEVRDVDGPVTLCGPVEAFDVAPCIDSAAIDVGGPVAVLDGEGVLHMRDNLRASELPRLLAGGAQLTVPVLLGVTPVAELKWTLRVLPPDPLLYVQGEPLRATVERLGSRIALTVTVAGSASSRVFVEASDVEAFSITTRGRQGVAGSDGSRGAEGSSGLSGASASCPSSSGGNGGDGGSGGNGGDGGDGGPGGAGGDVDLELVCGQDCADLERIARLLVRTEAGHGGPAGRGGAGGRGGSGGSGGLGTTCHSGLSTSFPSASLTTSSPTTHLSAGSRGHEGRNGSSGQDGRVGPPGRPGRVTVRTR